MNYKVLYRKYRPETFHDIVGQDYIVKTLTNSIISGNISHAYIFSGPRGTGKTSTAKVFAKAINCAQSIKGSPCNNCDFCKDYKNNPDIIEIDAASHNGVDQIRELIDNVKLTPSNSKYKVYIIDEVHMLTTSAFNALLLTLEEPPSHVIFILATTNVESVPITILSRSQRFDFAKISNDVLIEKMAEVCKNENILIEKDALIEIAMIAEGGMRDALSILDQLSKNCETITLEIVENQMKTIGNSSVKELMIRLENNDIKYVINYISLMREKAVDYKIFLKKVIEICSKIAIDCKTNVNNTRLMFNDYKNIVNDMIDCLNRVNINVDPYIKIELELLKYVQFVDSELNGSEPKLKENTVVDKEILKTTGLHNNGEDLLNIKINNCFVNVQKEYLRKAVEIFDNFKKDNVIQNKYSKLVADIKPVAASDVYIIFEVENEHHAYNLNDKKEKLERTFNEYGHTKNKFIFIGRERWMTEKKRYIENIKKNYLYKHVDESSLIVDTSQEIMAIADELFNSDKIEVV